jgi:HrpA-like RNA helicase
MRPAETVPEMLRLQPLSVILEAALCSTVTTAGTALPLLDAPTPGKWEQGVQTLAELGVLNVRRNRQKGSKKSVPTTSVADDVSLQDRPKAEAIAALPVNPRLACMILRCAHSSNLHCIAAGVIIGRNCCVVWRGDRVGKGPPRS